MSDSSVTVMARRHADVDEPLFDAELIPNPGDPRSVGELLLDVDRQTRQLLFDVASDDAAGLLRGWPELVGAAAQLWYALPGRPVDALLCEDLDRPMTRLIAITEGIDRAVGSQRWPGDGPVDHRFDQAASTLAQAADLVHRYGAEVTPEHHQVRGDIQATRTRLMHGVYLSAHATTVALHQRSRAIRAGAALAGLPLPLSADRNPYLLRSTADWIQRIGACERTAGAYLHHRSPHQLSVEINSLSGDPYRWGRALASWDIQAHRSLARHPTPANLVLISATQTLISQTSAIILKMSALTPDHRPGEDYDRVRPAAEAARRTWSELASRWRDLCLSTDPLDPPLARAAGEIRAACGEEVHAHATPAGLVNVHHRSELRCVNVTMNAFEAACELAQVVSSHAQNRNLSGPARALSLRAHNDIEAAVAAGACRDPGTVWVAPKDILARRVVTLPQPVASGLRDASTRAVAAATDAALIAGMSASGPCRPPDEVVSGESFALSRHEPAPRPWGAGACGSVPPGR